MEFNKRFTEEEDGFNGSYEAYLVNSEKENLKNFLISNIDDDGKIYEAIKENVKEVLIIKNLNIEEEYQGKGYGSLILNELINDSYAQAVLLIGDILESQKPGFILEKFYESHDFLTIERYQEYPLMIYPSQIAEKIVINLTKKSIKLKL